MLNRKSSALDKLKKFGKVDKKRKKVWEGMRGNGCGYWRNLGSIVR